MSYVWLHNSSLLVKFSHRSSFYVALFGTKIQLQHFPCCYNHSTAGVVAVLEWVCVFLMTGMCVSALKKELKTSFYLCVCEQCACVCIVCAAMYGWLSAGWTLRDQTSGEAFSEQNMAATLRISATFSKWTLKCSLPPTSTTVWTHLLTSLPPPALASSSPSLFFPFHSCPPFLSLSASSSSELLIASKIWRCKLCDHSPNQPPLLTEGARRRVGGV